MPEMSSLLRQAIHPQILYWSLELKQSKKKEKKERTKCKSAVIKNLLV